jgi:hypothetical protein
LDDQAAWLTPEADPHGVGTAFLTALAAPFEQVFGLVMDQGNDPDAAAWVPGYGALLDVDLCPTAFLPFLGQFNGTTIPTGASDAVARAIIRAEAGMQRGTPASIVAAAVRNLVGSRSVALQERTAADGSFDPYHFVLIVRPEELLWNQVPNPSFEYGLSNWTGFNNSLGTTTVSQVSDSATGTPGSHAFQCAFTTAAGGATLTAFNDNAGEQIPVAAGLTYAVLGSAKVSVAAGTTGTFSLEVRYYDASNVIISATNLTGSGQVTAPSVGTWYAMSGSWVAPVGAFFASVALQWTGVGVAGAYTLRTDAFLLANGPNGPVSYVDGDSGGFAWSGSPGASSTTSVGALTSAVNATKPGGVQWTLVQSDGPLLSQYTRLLSAVIVTLAAAQLADVV